MEEKILKTKKNGMLILLLSILIYAAAIAGTVVGGMMVDSGKNPALLIISIVFLGVTWLLWPGLKVLRPQEALVLTNDYSNYKMASVIGICVFCICAVLTLIGFTRMIAGNKEEEFQ